MNLRPSGYEPDELPDCSIPRRFVLGVWPVSAFPVLGFGRFGVAPSGECWGLVSSLRDTFCVSDFTRFGGDLLSHVLRRSTIGATALNGRVRDGTGCFARAMTTKPGKIRDTFMKSYRPEGYLRTFFMSYRLSAT